MIKTVRVLTVFAALWLPTGCGWGGHDRTIPDQTIPHRVARTVQAPLWVKTPDGRFIAEWYTIHEGWWVASPALIEPDPE